MDSRSGQAGTRRPVGGRGQLASGGNDHDGEDHPSEDDVPGVTGDETSQGGEHAPTVTRRTGQPSWASRAPRPKGWSSRATRSGAGAGPDLALLTFWDERTV